MPSDDRDQHSTAPSRATCEAPLRMRHARTRKFSRLSRALPLAGRDGALESHIASCSRCQETLALLGQTDSVAANGLGKRGSAGGAAGQQILVSGERHRGRKSPARICLRPALRLLLSKFSAHPAVAARTRRRVPWSIVVPTGALAAVCWSG